MSPVKLTLTNVARGWLRMAMMLQFHLKNEFGLLNALTTLFY